MELPTTELSGSISVYWDIKRCPVPVGYDARRVGPCIQRFLRKLRFTGPITISTVGVLSDVPRDILEAVSSTGIILHIAPKAPLDTVDLFLDYYDSGNPRPPNTMFISSPPSYVPPGFSSLLSILRDKGHNTIFLCPLGLPFPLNSSPLDEIGDFIWKKFLLADSGATGEPASLVEPGFWVCAVCGDGSDGWGNISGRGVENFIKHISTPDHEEELGKWITPCPCDEEASEAGSP